MNKTKIYKTNFIRKIIDKDLASGKYTTIRTRFPPEPNGYLHIGHAKSICLNFGIAEDYNGQCNLRFDDTNPTIENIEYVESIKEDIKWLGFNWFGDVCYSSNYFDQLYIYAIELINKGLAYVDELTSDQIRKYRGTLTAPGENSPYRNRNIEDNLRLFKKMRNGEIKEGKACLRAKIDMKSSFIIMRDPVLYRIKFIEHYQTKNKWCIYPTYDFTHCISDALEGITHSLCTLEFQDNRRLYDWILNNINIQIRPHQYEFSRLNLEYTIMSKRKLSVLVTKKYVEGWDDPRMPTLSGLRRRGYTANAIRNFCMKIGITKQNNTIKMNALESCIRTDLNKKAHRVMAIINPVKLIIENYPKNKIEMISMLNHPNKLEMGARIVPFSSEIWIDRADFREEADKQYKRLVLDNKEVRLRNAYVIKARHVEKDSAGNVTIIYCTYDAYTLNKNIINERKIKGVIHWVSVAHAVPIEIRFYEKLFNVPNPEVIDNFLSVVNRESLIIKHGYAEPSLKNAKIGKFYQFEREGYFCLDSRYVTDDRLVFNCTIKLRNTHKDS